MNRISEITKRDILDLFRSGIDIGDFFDKKRVTYLYFCECQRISLPRDSELVYQ
ncbi:hypothetical protein DesLBE_4016 [Desulfitobacterium sp. LBE]|nr:hypothetical protein DesLBE_4016 [Desulfitobacterium sp. LBE]